jgi:hypothetical protein
MKITQAKLGKIRINDMLFDANLTVKEGLAILRRVSPALLDVFKLQMAARRWRIDEGWKTEALERACGEYRGEMGEY